MKKIIIAFFIIIALVSCNKEDNNSYNRIKTVLLKERDTDFPLVLSKKKKTRGITYGIGTQITFDNCLGRSIKCDSYPLGNMEDLRYQVVDIVRFSNDYPSYFSRKK